jgi:hypothetical protein
MVIGKTKQQDSLLSFNLEREGHQKTLLHVC